MSGSENAPDGISDTERAVLGVESVADASRLINAYATSFLGSAVADVRFRSGRIDVVWGVSLDDGRAVAIKAHRAPEDLQTIAAASEAKRVLQRSGYPCPEPLSGPDELGAHVFTAESLLDAGSVPDGHDPALRQLLAHGLAWHIDALRALPDLRDRAGRPPAWCRYADGPWPTPHDTFVDFRVTPDGSEWLDDFATRASGQILAHRAELDVVVGHADWYAGNTTVADGVLTGTFDWELVADAEAVIAGFAAACYAGSSTSSAGLSTPADAISFLRDYGVARGTPFSVDEQRAAAGAVAWILAFNARWQVALRDHGLDDGITVTLVRERQDDYLALAW